MLLLKSLKYYRKKTLGGIFNYKIIATTFGKNAYMHHPCIKNV